MSSLLLELRRRLLRYRALRILYSAIDAYHDHNCVYMASALSFYAMLSTIPLTFIGLWGLTALVGSSEEAQKQLRDLLSEHLLPHAVDDILRRVTRIADAGVLTSLGTWWSVLAFVWSGVRFYESLHGTLSEAWGGHDARPFLQRKLLTLMAFIAAALFFLLTLLLTAAVTTARQLNYQVLGISLNYLWVSIAGLLPVFISIGMFFLIYKFLPNAHVPWRLALATASGVALLWEAGKRLFAGFIAHTGINQTIYGPMTGFILMMLWVYYSSFLLLFGAEVGAAWQREEEGFTAESCMSPPS